MMICIDLNSTDPYFNLATEEYLLKNSKGDYLIIGINDPSVIIGKHQVAHREADTKFVTENNIPVIRRISGGGTVYHDPGNINFSFIIQSRAGLQVDFRKYTEPVIQFLNSLGVNAYFEGRNDLKVKGLKISGNAEHVYRERVLHHGTILFNADLGNLKRSLRGDTSAYKTRAVESNPSSVINLKDLTSGIRNAEEFRSLMLDFFLEREGNISGRLTPGEEKEIGSLADSKYRSWEWNYAYGPEYQFTGNFLIKGKNYSCRLSVRDGIIRESELIGSEDMSAVSGKLNGCRHMPEEMIQVFRNENISLSGFDIFRFF